MLRSSSHAGGSAVASLSHRRLNYGCYWPVMKTAYAKSKCPASRIGSNSKGKPRHYSRPAAGLPAPVVGRNDEGRRGNAPRRSRVPLGADVRHRTRPARSTAFWSGSSSTRRLHFPAPRVASASPVTVLNSITWAPSAFGPKIVTLFRPSNGMIVTPVLAAACAPTQATGLRSPRACRPR